MLFFFWYIPTFITCLTYPKESSYPEGYSILCIGECIHLIKGERIVVADKPLRQLL